jgi:TolB-like protein
MVPQLVPSALKRALDLLETDPARGWTVDEIASACGIGRRTLQRHFRCFCGRTPMQFLRDLRLDRARQELLRVSGRASVTNIAARIGFNHLGRFATEYRARYGESPSATLSRNQRVAVGRPQRLTALMVVERPAIAVLPFDLIGRDAGRAAGITEEIASALMRVRWIAVIRPDRARYHLQGSVRDDGTGRLRVTIRLLDAATGRYLWADRWDGGCDDLFEFEERVAERIAAAIQQPMREAEIDRAWRKDTAQLNAWELTMRALPRVLSVEAAAEEMALELLERAMEFAPSDALPMALAAWCHGLRGCHNFCQRPDQEKAAARELARRCGATKWGRSPDRDDAVCRLLPGA